MKKHSRISPALSRIAERGLIVTEEQIRGFIPGATEMAIAEAMLAGCLTFQEIAESIERSPAHVSALLKDSLLCAWVSRHVHQTISMRLGMLDAAMVRKALGGDVRAYEAIMKRYGQSANLKIIAHVNGGDNFDLMSDKALDALLARRGAIDVKAEIGDVGPSPSPQKDGADQGELAPDDRPDTPTDGDAA